jgi:hypothetical protein
MILIVGASGKLGQAYAGVSNVVAHAYEFIGKPLIEQGKVTITPPSTRRRCFSVTRLDEWIREHCAPSSVGSASAQAILS